MSKKFDDFEIEELEDEEISEEIDAKVVKMMADAEEDFKEARVNIRWQKQQLDLIKKVSSIIGIPYQIYIRDIVFRKTVEDLEKFSSVLNK